MSIKFLCDVFGQANIWPRCNECFTGEYLATASDGKVPCFVVLTD